MDNAKDASTLQTEAQIREAIDWFEEEGINLGTDDRAARAFQIVRECAEALDNGIVIGAACSDEFHALLPKEIKAYVHKLRSRIKELETALAGKSVPLNMISGYIRGE